MKKLHLIIIASFLIAILPFFILLLSGDFMSLLLISFLLFFPFVFLILNYIYKRASHNQLKAIYHNLVSLKNVKKKQFSANDNAGLKEEINSILNDWSSVSKQEIDQLKKAEVYRKEFLGNVSHELKTPIFSVQGYVHTLIDGGIEDQDVNMLYLQKASKGIDRLISMVDDLESISKLEAGELPVEFRIFDIYELSKDVIDSVELLTRDKQIKLYINDTAVRPAYVNADKDLIRQVLVNLIVNSVKYGKKGGSTGIQINDLSDEYSIEVSDDGIGIEKYHLPRLFERFYRVDKSRSRDEGGTGLGLAIVKHIIEAHQQNIHVESEVGKGTTFSFTLKKSK